MARIVYNSKGNKLGSYDGNYAGKYWGHTIYNKNGSSRGYHDGNPEKTVRILLEK